MNTHIKSAILLTPFDQKYQNAVKQLILEGLVEHWGTIDPLKNPDLDDIRKSYKDNDFILAWHNGILVGTGALVRFDSHTSKIVRMSVKKDYRQRGIGKLILDHLVDLASDTGHDQVVLETTQNWTEVIKFYTTYGFQITHYDNEDVYFKFRLDD